MGDNRGYSADSRGHMGEPRRRVRRRGPRRRQGLRADLAVQPRRAHPPSRDVRRTSPNREVTRPAMTQPAPRIDRPPRRRPLRLRARAAPGRARRRSPASTRPAAEPAPARWSPRPRSCPRARPASCPGLADSKLLTAKARERCYDQVLRRALAWSVVVVEPEECDRLGMHVANVEALRRSLARLDLRPAYVLTDGFPVDGLEVPGLAMWKGDRVAACISAASVIAKVTRDRIMMRAARPTGRRTTSRRTRATSPTSTPPRSTSTAPAPVHRMRFVNVRRAAGHRGRRADQS